MRILPFLFLLGCAAEAKDTNQKPVEVFVDVVAETSSPVVLYVTHDADGEPCTLNDGSPDKDCCPRGWSLVGSRAESTYSTSAVVCLFEPPA